MASFSLPALFASGAWRVSLLAVAIASLTLTACAGEEAVSSGTDVGAIIDSAAADLTSLPDAIPPVDTPSGLDTVPDVVSCPGGTGCSCNGSEECGLGACVDGACVPPCGSDACPEGSVCAAVEGKKVCVPKWGRLCWPCSNSADCVAAGVDGAACVDQGPQGSFCGYPCAFDADCAAGYVCKQSKSDAGVSSQCVKQPTSADQSFGLCDCAPAAIAAKAETSCFKISLDGQGNLQGTCKGVRACLASGLSECTAVDPSDESCDGLDNDCDGETDEATCDDGNPCTEDACVPELGQCASKATSEGGSCDDGSACTTSDLCAAGVCKGEALDCDDGNPCTVDTCDAAEGCKHAPKEGVPCDDGNLCTIDDICQLGTCAAGAAKQCPDNNPCVSAACEPASGKCESANKPDNTPCESPNACLSATVCIAGGCVGPAKTCDDGNACTADKCEPASGCVYTKTSAPCDDGDACTSGDACSEGKCVGSADDAKVTCDDGNPCTTDTCLPESGCKHVAASGKCDDGSPCTVGDACKDGVCAPGTNTCSCESTKDCESKNSANPCNGTLYCDTSNYPYTCKINPATVVTCATDADTVCLKNQCEAVSGKCKLTAINDGAACDADGSLCTKGDLCKDGTCTKGALVDCDDGNPCTNDACDPKKGCINEANTTPCNADDNACTVGDVCKDGNCSPGAAKTCEDAQDCTLDSCDKASGKCVYDGTVKEGQPCDADGSLCTQKDACKSGLCVPGAPLGCNDDNPCTDDSCQPKSGCVFTANTKPCDADGSKCTVLDVCADKICQAGKAVDCDDGKPCTKDSCNPETGDCGHVPQQEGGPCDADGSVCTVGDVCKGGVCLAGPQKACDDNNPCTDDACDKVKGCLYANNTSPCDADGSACTIGDKCAAGICEPGSKKECDDDNPCTLDTCDPKSGNCSSLAQKEGAPCDADGDACTAGDKCTQGKCLPGALLKCDDANPCTTDSCDKAKGCTYVNNTAACDADGNACTVGDVCEGGKCIAGDKKICNDDEECTADSCDAKTGQCVYDGAAIEGKSCDADGSTCTPKDSCQAGKCTADKASPAGTACDDGNFCTTVDACSSAGECAGAKPKDCSDGNSCTLDSCDEKLGKCVSVALAAGAACDDGTYCTVGEVCDSAAKCAGGAPRDCKQGGCTLGTCDEAAGKCQGTTLPDGQPCDADGNACTTGDACKAGTCVPGAAKSCDDGNGCTVDSCDAKSGNCVFNTTALNGGTCNADNSACTPKDTCQDGKCVADKPLAAGSACNDGNFCTTGETCGAGNVCGAGKPNACDDGKPCTADSCDETAGKCVHTALTAGDACDDGLYCTVGETCDAGGTCGNGKPRVCGEGGCILGTCDESKQACVGQQLPDGTLCNADDDGCTKGDFCKAGKCVVGGPVNCYQPGDLCNKYSCTSTGADTYQCQNAPQPKGTLCDDSLYCTAGDSCDGAGKCVAGPARDCSAVDNACQTGTCDETLNSCVAENKADGTACDVSNPCTEKDVCKAGVCLAGNNICPAGSGGDDVKVSTFKASVKDNCSKWIPRPPGIAVTTSGQIVVSWFSGAHLFTRSFRPDLSREHAELETINQSWYSTGVAVCDGQSDTGWGGIDIVARKDSVDWIIKGGERINNGCWSYKDPVFGYCSSALYKVPPLRQITWGVVNTQRASGGLSPQTSYSQIDTWRKAESSDNSPGQTNSSDCKKWCSPPAADRFRAYSGNSTLAANGTVLVTWQEWYDGKSYGYAQVRDAASKHKYWLAQKVADRRGLVGATFDDSSYILAWTSGTNVYAQKFSQSGAANGDQFQVNTTDAGKFVSDAPLSVIALPNGRSVIAWESYDKEATESANVRVQLFKNEPGNKSGPERVANTSTTGWQGSPRLAYFSDNSYVLVWQDDGGRDGDGKGIIAQYFTASGQPKNAEMVVNASYKGDQITPNLAVDLANDLVVFAWVDNGDGGHVKMARYDINGVRDDGVVQQLVSETKTGQQQAPAVSAPRVTNLGLGDGSFVTAWESQNADGDGYGIMARRYAVDGKPKGAQFLVNTYKTWDQFRPDVAADSVGNFVVVWESMDQDGDLEGVFAQRYLNTGAKSGAEFRLNQEAANEQMRPQVAMNPNGSFVATWESFAPKGGEKYDVVVRCFDKDGKALSDDVIANKYVTGNQGAPAIATIPKGNGNFVVVWQSYNEKDGVESVGADWDIYARLFNASCKPLADPFRVNSNLSNAARSPKVDVDLDGNFTVTWARAQNGGTTNFDIEARRFDVNGLAIAADFKVNQATTGDQTAPDITHLPNGHFVITWETVGEDEGGQAQKAVEYDQKGEKTGLEWFVHRSFVGDQKQGRVAGRANGTWVFVWNHEGFDGDGGTVVSRLSNSGECISDGDCDDSNICTDNKCQGGKCQSVNNTKLCVTDGDACTVDDACLNGKCAGTLIGCNDNNICTNDSCDSNTGKCVFTGIPGCYGGCYYNDKPGCGGCKCEASVCNEMPSCCTEKWSSLCVQLCNDKYGGCDKGL